jgi:hypothetical protein
MSGSGGTSGGSGAAGSSGSDGSAGAAGANPDGGSDASPDSGAAGSMSDAGTDVPSDPANPVTNLAATVLDRRQTSFNLTWTAPSTVSGAKVSGYQVRYAKVPITAANFDDGTVTTPVAYANPPAPPGAPDGVTATGLYIENGYYFAVEAVGGGGARSDVVATSAPLAAHFNLTALSGSGVANEQFGFTLDANGDVNHDGKSDVLVGDYTGQHAYLFLGAASPSTTPTVTFSGDATTTSFGRGVAEVGDIDADGIDDIAIADRGKCTIYIFKGRATWPSTLGPTTADYVISSDASYSNSFLGNSIARLGDFNNDGIDDFAVGAPQYNGFAGRVLIVLGKAGFGSINVPDATNTITIDGDSSVSYEGLGYRVVGLGHFYPGGTTLVASAIGTAGAMSGLEGRLYAFHGQSGTNGAIAISTADAMVVGPGSSTRIGEVLSNLGPILGTSPSLGSGNVVDSVGVPGSWGNASIFGGDVISGPFSSQVRAYRSMSNNSGEVVIGGGISGGDGSFSLLGDATPDLLVAAQNGTTFDIVDGRTVRSAMVSIDVRPSATASIPVPAGWGVTGENEGRLAPDINGDGYPDIVVGDGTSNSVGMAVVYW